MLWKRYHKFIVEHVNASKSIHPFIQQVIDGAVEDVKSCLTSRCLHKSLPFPFSLNEASCVQRNDLGQLILSQTHSAQQCLPGMATQTNYFRQRNYTNAFCGPRVELAVGGGTSSTYGTPKRNEGKFIFALPQPAPLRVQARGGHKLL